MSEDFFSQFRQMVAMFLAEIIRSRRISLRRAAEISGEVIALLPQVHTEKDVLGLLTEVEKDFEEIVVLKQALHFGYNETDIKIYEHDIKEFAAEIFTKDMPLSVGFLQDASRPSMDIVKLCLKYPDFCQFLLKDPKKIELAGKLQAVTA